VYISPNKTYQKFQNVTSHILFNYLPQWHSVVNGC
jgi:hypothetical protein